LDSGKITAFFSAGEVAANQSSSKRSRRGKSFTTQALCQGDLLHVAQTGVIGEAC